MPLAAMDSQIALKFTAEGVKKNTAILNFQVNTMEIA